MIKKIKSFLTVGLSALLMSAAVFTPMHTYANSDISNLGVTAKTIYTSKTGSNTESTGNGSATSPYNLFKDAYAAANDGDTIIIKGTGFLNAADNSPFVINKAITIKGETGSVFSVRKSGIILGADVTFDNINFSFGSRYHDAIFANGHTLTLNNVSCENNARMIDIFGGSLYSGGTVIGATPGSNSRIIINGGGNNLGNIYAGSMNGDFAGTVNISLNGVDGTQNDAVYLSGADEPYVDLNYIFDLTEPDEPTPSSQYSIGGNVEITVESSDVKTVQQINKDVNAKLTVTSTNFNGTMDVDVDELEVIGTGGFRPIGMSSGTAVTLNGGVLDMSKLSGVTLASLTAKREEGNKLILNKEQTLEITGNLSGAFDFETENGSIDGNSGTATYNHTYITVGGTNSANISFTPSAGQDRMVLQYDKASNSWKTNDYYDVVPYIASLSIDNPTIVTYQDEISGISPFTKQQVFNGVLTWPSSLADKDKCFDLVPMRVTVNHKGNTYSVDTYDGEAVFEALHMSIYLNNSDTDLNKATITPVIYLDGNSSGAITKPALGTYDIILTQIIKEEVSQSMKLIVVETPADIPDSSNATVATSITAEFSKATADLNETIDISAKVTASDSSAVTGEADVLVNGAKLGTYNVTNGVLTVNDVIISGSFVAGINEITVMFKGTDKYLASQNTIQLVVNTPADTPVAVTSVSLPDDVMTLTAGSGGTMNAVVLPDNADNKKVTWKSDATDVVEIDENGSMKAYKAGIATITVTTDDGGFTDTRKVQVNPYATPGGLKAVTTSNSAINLSWTVVPGAEKYEISRGTAVNGPFNVVTSVAGTTYVNSGLSGNTTYYYRIRAYKNYNGKSVFSNYTAVVNAKTMGNPVLNGVTVKSSANKGQTITIKANTGGYTTGAKYKYSWSYNNGSKTGVIKDYISDTSVNFNLGYIGKYTFTVSMKLPSGSVQTKTATMNSIDPYAFTVNSITVPAKANAGQTITLKANTSGNTAGLQYKFVWMRNNWSPWGVIRNFGTGSSTSFKIPAAGTYTFYVDVKGKDGRIITKTVNLTAGNPSNFNVSKVTVPSLAVVGNTVNISGTATGNTYGLKYKFVWMKDNWKQWGVVREFGTSNSTSFKLPVQGKITFYVDVQATNGKTITKTAVCDVKSTSYYSLQSVSAPTSGKVGQSVTVKPNVFGNKSNLQYKYVWSWNNWQDWGVIKDFSSATSASTVLKYPGKYDFYVDVRKGSGGAITSKKVSSTVTLNWNPTSIGVSSTRVKLGTTVKLTGNVSGATNGLQYKFVWMKDNWKSWNVVRNFSTTKTATYKPASKGTHTIYMDVKDKYGNIKTISRNITVY